MKEFSAKELMKLRTMAMEKSKNYFGNNSLNFNNISRDVGVKKGASMPINYSSEKIEGKLNEEGGGEDVGERKEGKEEKINTPPSWRRSLFDDRNFSQSVPYDFRKIEMNLQKASENLNKLNPFHTLVSIYEFTKFSSALSMGFQDITEKVMLMREIFRNREDADDIQSLLDIEIKEGIHELNGDNNQSLGFKNGEYKKYISACRTFLRLLWFMEYLIHICEKIVKEDEEYDFKKILSEAYNEVLSKRHPWLVRNAVNMALKFSSAGKVKKAIKIIFDYDSYTEEARDKIKGLIELMKKIWGAGNDYYEKHNILDLK